jgi:NarL family two-component system response regulator LiaR
MTIQRAIKVMVVDDHPIVRDGLKNMFLVFDDLELIGEAENGSEALALCQLDAPDVILMDIVMPGMDGIQFSQR